MSLAAPRQVVQAITSVSVGWDKATGPRSFAFRGNQLVASIMVCGSNGVASMAVCGSNGVASNGVASTAVWPYVLVSTTTAETMLCTIPVSATDII